MRRLHLQANHKQKNHHPQLRNVQNRLPVRKQPQLKFANRQPRRQIAQHRTQPQPFKQRHRHHRRAQQRNNMRHVHSVLCCRHCYSLL